MGRGGGSDIQLLTNTLSVDTTAQSLNPIRTGVFAHFNFNTQVWTDLHVLGFGPGLYLNPSPRLGARKDPPKTKRLFCLLLSVKMDQIIYFSNYLQHRI